jgi:hypothetical protein
MHRYRQSRSRILFDVFCAFAVAASLVGAWMQTGASALLPAAGVAALFGLVHAFDMAGPRDVVSVEPQRIDFTTDEPGALALDYTGVLMATVDHPVETDKATEQSELAIPAASREAGTRRTKAPRKGSGRRTKAVKETNVTELASLEEAETASIHHETAQVDSLVALEEVAHPHIEALFEPEPFARMPRRAFGRKGG